MLTLLRKIRKSLIDSGSSRKYLLYAIGEIALVVIGILIALQINNWNESRKDRQWEKYYLNRLKQDLQKDLAEINNIFNRSYRRFVCGNEIIRLLDDDFMEELLLATNKNQKMFITEAEKRISRDSLPSFSRMMNTINFSLNVDIRSNTFNEIMSNGRLEVIRNDDLRENLSEYYSRASDFEPLNLYLSNATKEHEKILIEHDISIINNLTAEEFKSIMDEKGNQKYLAVLKNLIYHHVRTRTIFRALLNRANQLISNIELQLNSM
ncbi:MAG: DUF6090 family protein [Saprospiraceae bacterium]|nr:DUF6090 family protein [Saprospiraceae bacterium]